MPRLFRSCLIAATLIPFLILAFIVGLVALVFDGVAALFGRGDDRLG